MLKIACTLSFIVLLSWNAALAQTASSYSSSGVEESDECAQGPGLCDRTRNSNLHGVAPERGQSRDSLTPDSMRADGNTIRGNDARKENAIRVTDGPNGLSRVEQRPEAVVPFASEPPTEFQRFVEESFGKPLPLFGYNLFQNVPSTFAPVDRIPVPANYVIGPSDELLIRVWGQIDVDARVVVDRNGQIYLPKVGSITVAGTSYDQLPNHLKSAVGRVFRNFDLQVTLGQLRSIQIFVVGYARRPGAYTVSSLSTLVNALFASGGPSVHGSLRHIQVKRANRIVTDFDMYDLLLNGDKSNDVVLLPGDVIYIPPVGPQVALAGSLNFPAIYELHSTATLAEELAIAGGLTNVADGQRVVVERIENRTTRKVDEFALDAAGERHELRDGDLVRVFSLSPKFENAVTLRGNVSEPGRYPFKLGMRVRDLIPSREFLLTRSFWRNQNAAGNGVEEKALVRPSTSELHPLNYNQLARSGTDRAVIASQADLRNDVKRNAPEINWDYAVIQRINPVDLSTSLIPFNLGRAILDGSDEDNVTLQPGDVVTIFSQRDIAVPNEHQSKFVRLEGEFRAPGVYKALPGETLRSLIARAGGLTAEAYIFGAEFTRESTREQQQASLNEMVQKMETDAQRQAVYAATAHPDQQQNLQAQTESQRTLIQKLREVKSTGRIVLEIKPSQTGVDAFPEVQLQDGDALLVPHKPAVVSVVGSVYNQGSFLFRGNSRVIDYLKLSGGGNRDADMKQVFVIRADGSVLSRNNTSGLWSGGFSSIRSMPGDTLVVPAKLDKGGTLRAIKDWSQIIGQVGLGAAAINVLK